MKPKKSRGRPITMIFFSPFGDSVDDYIERKSYSFRSCKFDDAVAHLTSAGIVAEM